MQHDWKHVERPGESHTALDGKKCFSAVCFQVWLGDFRIVAFCVVVVFVVLVQSIC